MAPDPTRDPELRPALAKEDEDAEVQQRRPDCGGSGRQEQPEWVDKYAYTGKEVIWLNAVSIVAVHALAVWAFCAYAPRLSLVGWVWNVSVGLATGFGVTGGAHRLWTHRSYKAKTPLRVLLMLCFSASGQNSIYDWVRDHRVHHKFSETDADPHNVKRGFFFAHVGWLMLRKHPEVRRRGQQIDMSDVLRDPVAAFQIKFHTPLKLLTCFALPVSVPALLWAESWEVSFWSNVVRYVITLNTTWLVNSAAHTFGNKPFQRDIAPTENVLVSVLAMGEGWHNYHHVFPWDYKAAELGDVNLTLHMLNAFARLGWAYDLKAAPAELVRRVAERYGDGSHPRWGCGCDAPEVPEAAARCPDLADRLLGPRPRPGPEHAHAD